MARRSRSSFSPAWIIAGISILVAAFFAGNFFLTQVSEPYRTVAPLEVEAYLENSNSLRGNVYKVEGEILNVLGYSPATRDRLISVGIDGTSAIVPIVIPGDLSHVNIQKGQKFHFRIAVDADGILRTEDLTKA